MLRLLLEDFKKAYDEKGDKLITDNYKLDSGLYIKVSKDGSMETLIATKEKELTEMYAWFVERDFVSKYINSNKCIPYNQKKIHSNNYLTWFIKKKTFFDEKDKLEKDKILEITENYYNFLDENNLNNESVISILEKEFDKNAYGYCKGYMLSQFDSIVSLIKSIEGEFDNYIKVFFDLDYDIYIRESNRYLYHKIFNTENHKIESDYGVLGVSNFNMGLNSKKPYLEHKTMKIQVPFRVTLEEALLGYKYSQYLKDQGYGDKIQNFEFQFNMPLDKDVNSRSEGYSYMYLSQNNGEVEIRDFDIIPSFDDSIDCKVTNHLGLIVIDGDIKKYRDYSKYGRGSIQGITMAINDLMFNNCLINSFKKDPKDLTPNKFLTKSLINYILLSQDLLFDFYKKGVKSNLQLFIDRFGYDLVVENLINKGYRAGADAYNVYYSIKNQKEGEFSMGSISGIKESIINKLNDEKTEDFENNEEYSFAAGQLAYFLFTKSASYKKSHDLVDPFLNRDNVCQINDELMYWFKRYSHGISINNKKFNKLFSMTMGYDKEQNKIDDMFLAGYLSDNILYMKMEEETDENQ